MIFDPHDESFISKNLDREEWVEYCRDDETANLANQILEVFDQGLVAKIDYERLDLLGFKIACIAGTHAALIQMKKHSHWAGMALCMLTHGRMEDFPEEKVYRFSKSPCDNEPMYYHNIEYVPCYGKSWMMAVRKRPKDEVKNIGATGLREDDSTSSIPGEGVGGWDKTGQGRLFNVYSGS